MNNLHLYEPTETEATWQKQAEKGGCKEKLCCCPYRSVGADGGEGVGSTGKQPVPIHQQHPDVVLALLLWKHTSKHTYHS